MEQAIKHGRLYNVLMESLNNVEEIVKIVLKYSELNLWEKICERKFPPPLMNKWNLYSSWNKFLTSGTLQFNFPIVHWEECENENEESNSKDTIYLWAPNLNHLQYAVEVEKR
jgi:hypothetical protein